MAKIIFFGTPEYVLPILQALHKSFVEKGSTSPIVAIVTQKPKPVGRKKLLEYSPVETWANKKDIPVYFDAKDLVRDAIKAGVCVLASYGQILTKEVINHFPKGIVNIHPSLLPKYRGSSPIPAALITGETETGVSITKMDEGIDMGELISSFKEEILPTDDTKSLRDRLFEKSAQVLIDLLPSYLEGKIKLEKLGISKHTFSTKVNKEDAHIHPKHLKFAMQGKVVDEDWKIGFIKNYSQKPSARTIEQFIRAMKPWPIAWTTVLINENEKRLKILDAHLEDNRLVLDRVQLEGKNEVSFKQFQEGYPNHSLE